jgi:hypothetical protein
MEYSRHQPWWFCSCRRASLEALTSSSSFGSCAISISSGSAPQEPPRRDQCFDNPSIATALKPLSSTVGSTALAETKKKQNKKQNKKTKKQKYLVLP